MINIDLKNIKDKYIYDALKGIEEELTQEQPWMKGKWQYIEKQFSAASADAAIAHNLKFAPKDVIILSKTNDDSTSVTIHWDDFDDTYIYLTTDGAVNIRMYVGTHEEEL